MKTRLSNTLLALALTVFALTPAISEAGDKDKRGKSGKSGWNQKSKRGSSKNRNQDYSYNRDRDSSWQQDRTSAAQREYDRRQQTKNEWRNIAYVSGAVAVLGLLRNDKTLTFAGAAGALYSIHRYEQDRKSQNSLNRARATYFSKPYFVRDGVRYDRRVVTKNGQKYYQFTR